MDNSLSLNLRGRLVSLRRPLVMGIIIYLIYCKFYRGVIFSRSFAITLVGMSFSTKRRTISGVKIVRDA